MEARFQRTANVLQGWTRHHPRQPPMPEVAKTTGFERGGGEVFALDMTILLQEIVVDCGKIECSDRIGRLHVLFLMLYQ